MTQKSGLANEVRLERIPKTQAPKLGWAHIRGEIRDLRTANGTTYFELTVMAPASDRLHTIAAEVTGDALKDMQGYWARTHRDDPNLPLRDNEEVELEGHLFVDTSWNYRFSVRQIKEAHGTGAVTKANEHALKMLARHGVEEWRLGDISQLVNRHPHRWIAPTQLKRLLVVAGEGTHALSDIKSKLRGVPPDQLYVKYDLVPWAEEPISNTIGYAVKNRFDLILIATGGGPSARRQKYQDTQIALQIWNAKVPVVTALGHARDVSTADRLASFAFDTPDDAAKSIRSAVYLRLSNERNDAQAQLARDQASLDEEREYALLRSDRLAAQLEETAKSAMLTRVRYRTNLVFLGLIAIGFASLAFGLAYLFPDGEINHTFLGWIPTIFGVASCIAGFTWRSKSAERLKALAPQVPIVEPESVDDWLEDLAGVRNLRQLQTLANSRTSLPKYPRSRAGGNSGP